MHTLTRFGSFVAVACLVLTMAGCGGGGGGDNNNGPTARLAVTPTTGDTTTNFTFDASGSSDPVDQQSQLQYRWDFGDGTVIDYAASASQTHKFAAAGTKTVTVTVRDSRGLTADTTQSVVVTTTGGGAPTAAFTVTPATGDTTTSFAFDASGSSDPHNSINQLQFRWDFGDGTVVDYPNGTKNQTHQYASAGTKTVTLTVRNTSSQTNSVSHTVTVNTAGGGNPTAAFTVSPASGDLSATNFTFDGSASTDPNGSAANMDYRWDYGDGTIADWTKGATVVHHTYDKNSVTGGMKTVTLQVRNSASKTASVQHQVELVPYGTMTFGASTYAPNTPLNATIAVKIPTSAQGVYALQETVPQGWTVSNISNDGALDPTNSSVIKWIFLGSSVRTVTFTVTPPAGASGSKAFAGQLQVSGFPTQAINASIGQ